MPALDHYKRRCKELTRALRQHGMSTRYRMAEGGTHVRVGIRCDVCDTDTDEGNAEAHARNCPLSWPQE